MATLVLNAVGTYLGGPVGGAIGSTIGQAIDARLFSPKGRKGPRLDELRVQTSSYGVPVPRLYGRMRVAGTVIWATDLVEHRNRRSNGKGRGSDTTYSYSLSMAVALSSRRVRSVGRIWAEGNLLRGADGLFKSPVTFRLHDGSEDQPVDPFVAAAEGVGQAPAFRGLAYALFEDFDLAPFGNRVPSLTFEVEADEGVVSLTDPLRDMLGTVQVAGAVPDIAGYALAAETREAAVVQCERVMPVVRAPGGEVWTLGLAAAGEPVVLGEPAGRREDAKLPGGDTVPRQVTVSAFDPARDFQVGEQSARVAGGAGQAERLALPVAMAAEDAKQLAASLAHRAAMTRREIGWPQGFAALAVQVHDRAQLPGDALAMLVSERRIEGDAILLTLRDQVATLTESVAADPGRAIAAPDLDAGTSVGALFDLPAMTPADFSGGRLALAAGGGPGWRAGRVQLRPTAGAPLVDLGVARPVAVLGTVESVPDYRGAALFDRAGTMIVALHSEAMTLGDASEADLLAGANLAAAGGEVLQFGRAEPLGAGRWRLSGLLRGRFGCEDDAAALAAGDGFTMVDDAGLFPVPAAVGLAMTGTGGVVMVEGTGDAVPLELDIARVGSATLPLSPVHLRGVWRDDDALMLRWVRRSRSGFAWIDGVDAPLDVAVERYRLIYSGGGSTGSVETGATEFTLSAAEIAAMRPVGPLLSVAVAQIGDAGLSPFVQRDFALD